MAVQEFNLFANILPFLHFRPRNTSQKASGPFDASNESTYFQVKSADTV